MLPPNGFGFPVCEGLPGSSKSSEVCSFAGGFSIGSAAGSAPSCCSEIDRLRWSPSASGTMSATPFRTTAPPIAWTDVDARSSSG
jgi:hypothetical protein